MNAPKKEIPDQTKEKAEEVEKNKINNPPKPLPKVTNTNQCTTGGSENVFNWLKWPDRAGA